MVATNPITPPKCEIQYNSIKRMKKVQTNIRNAVNTSLLNNYLFYLICVVFIPMVTLEQYKKRLCWLIPTLVLNNDWLTWYDTFWRRFRPCDQHKQRDQERARKYRESLSGPVYVHVCLWHEKTKWDDSNNDHHHTPALKSVIQK